MPASYTHYCFGQEVLALLPENQRAIVLAHRELYDIGLHGPDIFFYYQPLHSNPISRIGYSMHDVAGRDCFGRFLSIWEKTGREPAALAYLYGFLCHFALDSTCHRYVGEMTEKGFSHSRQEMELDRSFLVQRGLDPVRQDLVAHIHPTPANAKVIAPFFPEATVKQVEKALSGMVFYHHLLMAPNHPKRWLLQTVTTLTGNQASIGDMVMSLKPGEDCKSLVEHLRQLYTQALPLAVSLIEAFPALKDPQYRLDFEGQDTEKREALS